MIKAYKYRLYPNQTQSQLLQKSFGCARFIYNWGLVRKTEEYARSEKNLSCFHLMNELASDLKKEKQWLNEPAAQSLQMSLRNLDNAFTRFFKKQAKFPQFKKKYKSRKSCQFPQSCSVDWDRNYVKLPKLGKVKAVLHRKFTGKIKTVTASQNSAGQYFVSILVESIDTVPEKLKVKKSKTIGIDLGLINFTVDSNGNKTEAPKPLKKVVKRIAKLDSKKAKFEKGSTERKRLQLKINRLYNKATNIRHDFLHKLSRRLIRENQTICLETLDIEAIKQKTYLAGDVSDVSWGTFVEYLKYKADWYGTNIIQISQFAPSTKLCSNCGHLEENLTLADREWTCRDCNVQHDRDINAAKNIKTLGLESLAHKPRSPVLQYGE